VREILASRKAIPGRVSVIIPVYDGERFILGAVRSALRQTYRDLEVIVVDDGSTDATAARLAGAADPRVTVLHQPNQGLSAARNTALAQASGQYIALLDADDRWFPEKLALDVRTLEARADPVAVAYSWYYAVDDSGKLLHRSRPHRFAGRIFDVMLRTDDFILPSASFFHRRIFEQIGGFDVGAHHEDSIFFLKASKMFPIWPTQRHLVVYRQTIQGLGRRKLADFESARRENLSIVDCLRPHLSTEEIAVLRHQKSRSLYFRFLMYGFNRSANRMLPDVDVSSLRHGAKGWLAWLHAKSGLNLMCPLRLIIQGANGAFGQRRWRKVLSRAGLDLAYGRNS
jgi:glycosyltransferase involved in cell wall biosynthesis